MVSVYDQGRNSEIFKKRHIEICRECGILFRYETRTSVLSLFVTEKEYPLMTKKFCGALSAALAIVLTLSACGGKTQPAASSQRADGSVSSSASSASQSGGSTSSGDGSTQQPDASQPDQSQQPDGSAPAISAQSSYDFSQPVPEREAVDNRYFDDAAFVGDSRTDGFLIYSGIGTGKNLTSNGLSIFKLEEKKALTIDGKEYTLLEALALQQYGKVYLSLGVNELGYYDDQGFYDNYCKAIDDIRRIQPHAVIYIQNLIPLNEEVIAQTTKRTYLTNEHLRVYNDLIKKAAQEKQVAYLDLYSEFVNENGELPAEASKDGVHLRSDWCKQWLTYLQTHTVDFDTLYPTGEQPQV